MRTMNEELFSNAPVQSVSEISNRIKAVVENNFDYVKIRGEISGLSRPSSGHIYLKLKDAQSVIDATIWKSKAMYLKLKPEDGLEVIVSGKITTYGARSSYQLSVETMEIAGEGALLKLLNERKKKLQSEGLFDSDRKRQLPYMPKVIGVITSPTGAVIRDIIHRVRERFPCQILVWGVSVQGDNAREEITKAIIGFNRLPENMPQPDVLIVARGGGSIEDLWAFNEESVVRAASESRIPIISAVGHETDTTLIDFAADKRAPTPTAAAEMAVPVIGEIYQKIDELSDGLHFKIRQNIQNITKQLQAINIPAMKQILTICAQKYQQLFAYSGQLLQQFCHKQERILQNMNIPNPKNKYEVNVIKINELSNKINVISKNNLQNYQREIQSLSRNLENLNYKKTLNRGFAIITDSQGKLITTAQNWHDNQENTIIFSDETKKIITK